MASDIFLRPLSSIFPAEAHYVYHIQWLTLQSNGTVQKRVTPQFHVKVFLSASSRFRSPHFDYNQPINSRF